MGIFIITIAIIPITAAELFIRFILPSIEEYASLIDEPKTGINELIANRIPFTATESIETDITFFSDKKPVKTLAVIPRINDAALFAVLSNLFILNILFILTHIHKHKKQPREWLFYCFIALKPQGRALD